MRFASLGSGSEGNALLVECGSCQSPTRLLIDCGFGIRESTRRLERLGVAVGQIDAIFVTHEHGDHLGGAARLALGAGAQLHMTSGTAAGLVHRPAELRLTLIDAHQPLDFLGVRIEPVAVPHDAREPVQFVIDDGRVRLGVLTDLGHGTAHVVRAMSRLDAIVLECNHDEALLEASDYPRALKRRIAGPYGHLENGAAAALLGAIDQSRLRTVVAAHLSRSNNRADLVRSALSQAWAGSCEMDIRVADQDAGITWTTV